MKTKIKSIIKINNIFAEDIFEWFYNHIQSCGGDGSAAIVCFNYEEAAEFFLEWFRVYHLDDYYFLKNKNQRFFYEKDKTEGCINFHDSNENFIFTDNKDIFLGSGYYVFEITENCEFGWTESLKGKWLKA